MNGSKRSIDRRQFVKAIGGAAGAGAVVAGVPAFAVGRSSGGEGGSAGGSQRAIKIGASLPLTGYAAADGDLQRRGVQMAVDEANEAGGVAGRKVELVVLDSADMTPEKNVANFRALISRERVDGIAGGYVLFTGAEYPVVAQAGTPYLHVNTQESNADAERKDPERHWMCFQCVPTEIWYGRGFPAMVERLQQSGFKPRNKKIAVLAASDPYGTRIAVEVRDAMQKAGWKISLFEKVVAPVSEWGPVLAKVRRDPPDIIFSTDVSAADTAALTKQFRDAPTPSLLYGQYGPSQPEYKKLTGSASDGVIWSSTSALLPDELGRAFRKRWSERYDVDPGLSASGHSHDMATLLLRGIAQAGGPEDRRAVCEAIRSDRYRGVNGMYVFSDELRTIIPYPDETVDPSIGIPHTYFQIQNGVDKLIAPEPFTDGEFELPPWF